jgi:hypothetical protein
VKEEFGERMVQYYKQHDEKELVSNVELGRRMAGKDQEMLKRPLGRKTVHRLKLEQGIKVTPLEGQKKGFGRPPKVPPSKVAELVQLWQAPRERSQWI